MLLLLLLLMDKREVRLTNKKDPESLSGGKGLLSMGKRAGDCLSRGEGNVEVGQVSGLIRRRRRAVIFARPGAGRTDAGKHSTAFGSGFSISRGRRKGSLFRTAARQR
ncbi:hypothetical protein C0Q70_09780 [Pomacea canaliculata]|uniref:Uncharacterized protein n=1 Tax=Pomacea canaliculata TaxID=400727 RepID=A0A2T7PAR6_POMCA|nr:hypothetical protein C0Q70_09780 [Pomacea canaliculata]